MIVSDLSAVSYLTSNLQFTTLTDRVGYEHPSEL